MTAAVTLDRYAEIRAEMEAGRLRDDVLARAGILPDDWIAAQFEWLDRMGKELERDRFELTNRYTQVFVERLRALKAAEKQGVTAAAPSETPEREPTRVPEATPVLEAQPALAAPLGPFHLVTWIAPDAPLTQPGLLTAAAREVLPFREGSPGWEQSAPDPSLEWVPPGMRGFVGVESTQVSATARLPADLTATMRLPTSQGGASPSSPLAETIQGRPNLAAGALGVRPADLPFEAPDSSPPIPVGMRVFKDVHGTRFTGAVPPVHRGPRAMPEPASAGETLDVRAAMSPPLPFSKPPQPAPPRFDLPAADTAPLPGDAPRDQRPPTTENDTIALPMTAVGHAAAGFAPTAPPASPHVWTAVPDLTVEQYAAACAAMSPDPVRAAAVFAKYGIAGKEAWTALIRQWDLRLGADPELRTRWMALMAEIGRALKARK